MNLTDAERAKTAAAIKHFEALQKRYTRQHNGTACEYVRLALIGLKRLSQEPEVVRGEWIDEIIPDEDDNGTPYMATWHKCSVCGKKVFFNFQKSKFCADCGAQMDGERRKEQDDG